MRAFLSSLSLVMLTAAHAWAGQYATKPSAVGRYWRDFKDYWSGAFANQSAVVLVTLGAGAVAMFIITRGKWKK